MGTEDGITLNDPQEKMVDISEGNPGALSILVQLYPYTEVIDYLHEYGPRGSGLWMLYKDSNGEDIEQLLVTLVGRMREQAPELAEALGLRLLEAFAALAG